MRVIGTIIAFLLVSVCVAQIQSAGSGDWNNSATWIGGSVPGSTDDIEIISGHAITLTADASVQDIILTNGSILIGSNTFSIYGDISGAAANNIFTTSSSIISIQDKGDAAIFTFPSNTQIIQKLIINRSSGAESNHNLDLDDNVPVDGSVLVLTNGILYMNNSTILFLNSKSIERDIACSDSSFVDGIIQRNIPHSSGVYVFPVGNNSFCRPFGIGLQNGNSDNISEVQFIYDTPVNSNNIDYGKLAGGIFPHFYWRHEIISGANAQRRIYYEDSDFPGITAQERIDAMTLANTDGVTAWTRPTTGWTVDDTNKWVEFDNANASNNEYWTFGSISADVPIEELTLPIELTFFDAEVSESSVILLWETATETNNDFFTIERSLDGFNFIPITTQTGAGNSHTPISYSYIDDKPQTGISYYRIKQTDYNGNSTYSAIIEVFYSYTAHISLERTNKNIVTCKISSFEPDEASISIIHMNGKIIETKSDILLPGKETVFTIDISTFNNEQVIFYIKTSTLSKKIKYIANDRP